MYRGITIWDFPKLTAVQRWPPYSGDHKDRFHCTTFCLSHLYEKKKTVAGFTINAVLNFPEQTWYSKVPYSLEIMPPSNTNPPHFLQKFVARYLFVSNLSPPDHMLLDEITSNLRWSTQTRLSAKRPRTLEHLDHDKLCNAITCDCTCDFQQQKLLNSGCLVAFQTEM